MSNKSIKNNLYCMLSEQLQNRLAYAIKSDQISKEICKRISLHACDTEQQIREVNLDDSKEMNDNILSSLQKALGHYHHGECGLEIANTLIFLAEKAKKIANGKIDHETRNLLSNEGLEVISILLNSVELAKEFEKNYDFTINKLTIFKPTKKHLEFKEPEEQSVSEKPVFVKKRIRLKR